MALQAKHVVLPGEDPEEFEALVRGLEENLLPVGPLEMSLVARIADCTWCLQRARLIEAAMMRREHFKLQSARAEGDMERARDTMRWVQNVFDYVGDDDEEEEEETSARDHHNLPEEEAEDLERTFAEAEEAYESAKEIHEEAEKELANSSDVLDLVFLRSTDNIERLSRYETTIERRLRNAMQDLERLQAIRRVEAAETATVINVTDLNEEEG